jgi:hypothetical protein
MKKGKMKRVVPLVLAMTFVFAFTSCGESESASLVTDENKDNLKYTVAKTWDYEPYATCYYSNLGEDVMPIIGMWSPWDAELVYGGQRIPNLATDEMYQAIAESGVNVMFNNNVKYDKEPEKVMFALDECAKYGMVYAVSDSSYCTWGAHASSGVFLRDDQSVIHVNQEQFEKLLSAYAHHKGFGGLYFIDEPNPYIYPSYKKLSEMYYKALDNIDAPYAPLYWNAFPSGYLTRNYGYDYKQHLKEFGLASGYVSFDNYPFQWGMVDDFSTGWFSNLNYAYDVAKENNIPFGSYIATGGNWSGVWDDNTGTKALSIEQLIWQVNTLVAYGAKQVHYYTLNQPFSNINYNESGGELGIFDSFGNKTKYFYATKMVNSQIQACDHILMKATQHGVISTGYIMGDGKPTEMFRDLITERKFRELVSVSENSSSFIGCFDYFGKTVLYVVNGSYYDKAEITLGFDDTYCYDVTQRAQTASVVGKKFTLKLSPGESAMVVLK